MQSPARIHGEIESIRGLRTAWRFDYEFHDKAADCISQKVWDVERENEIS